MSRQDAAALSAATAAIVSIVVLPWTLSADDAVYRWLQFHRTCSTASDAETLQLVVVGVLAVVAGGTIITGAWRCPRQLFAAVAVVVSGAAVGEILKTAIERLRPRSLPMALAANSFPSGHIMNTTLVAVVTCLLARRSTVPGAVRAAVCGIALASIPVQAAARVLIGSHWVSDVPGSVLLGVAWALGAGSVLDRLSARERVAVVILALGLFVLVDLVPATRLVLPSALDDTALRSALRSRTVAHRMGDAHQADASATAEQRFILRNDGSSGQVKMALQARCPAHVRRCCVAVTATVNDWKAPPVIVTRGWREYRLVPPTGVLREGENVVSLNVRGAEPSCAGSADACGHVRLRYARLAPSTPAVM
jgi:membrane-associated phospholipid phosphatase